MPRRRRRSSVLASILAGGLGVLVIVAALVLNAERTLPVDRAASEPTPTPTATATPTPPPEPEPEPEPEPDPVSGELVAFSLEDLSVGGTGLYGGSTGATVPDQAAAAAFGDELVTLVDHHLVDLQRGGAGTLVMDGLVGDESVLRPIADDDEFAAIAYTVRVGAREQPEWGSVAALLTRPDGSEVATTFVFAPGDAPSLLAVRR